MNFFQKLTGSLKMPAEENFLPEQSQPTPQRTQPPAPEPPAREEPAEIKAKTTSFAQMLVADKDNGTSEENDASYSDKDNADEDAVEETVPEDTGVNLTTAELASAHTVHRRHLNPIKKLSSLRLRKEPEEKKHIEAESPEGQLAIDVYETPEEIVIKSTIAGVKPENLDVGIEDNTVNIRGSRHNEEKVKGEDYFYQECYWGTFSRSVILPVEVDAEKSQASLKDGILTIRLPKIIKEKETKIKVLS